SACAAAERGGAAASLCAPAGEGSVAWPARANSVAVLPGRRRGRNSGTGAVSNGRRENIGATSALQSYFWEPYLAVPAARIFAPGALILRCPSKGEGRQSADRRWVRNAAPVARLAVGPISGEGRRSTGQ